MLAFSKKKKINADLVNANEKYEYEQLDSGEVKKKHGVNFE